MDEILENLERQVAEGAETVPVSPTDAVEAARESVLGRLFVALTDDREVHLQWARSMDFDRLDALGQLGWMQADLERVDARIDAELESERRGETIELLARSGVGWRHEALVEAIDGEAHGAAAARVLARSTPGELRSRLIECEVVDRTIELLRAAVVERASELWDQFLIWRQRVAGLEELDEQTRRGYLAQLDGTGAALEPTLYARGLLAGDYEAGWLQEGPLVADFLQIYGSTDWLEVVGMLEAAGRPSAERLAATLAVAAAAGVGSEPPGEQEAEDLLDLLAEAPGDGDREGAWESLATGLGLGFQMAMGEGDFALLLAQVAAHERLVTHGIHSPGIPGLPMSATSETHLEASRMSELLGELVAGEWTDEQEVRAVRTLCDARVWSRRDEECEQLVRAVAAIFEQASLEAIETARAQVMATLDEARRDWEREQFEQAPDLQGALVLGAVEESPASDRLVELLAERAAAGQTPLAMDALRYLGRMPTEGVLERLGELWSSQLPVLRAPFARRVLEEAIAVRHERRREE